MCLPYCFYTRDIRLTKRFFLSNLLLKNGFRASHIVLQTESASFVSVNKNSTVLLW